MTNINILINIFISFFWGLEIIERRKTENLHSLSNINNNISIYFIHIYYVYDIFIYLCDDDDDDDDISHRHHHRCRRRRSN